MNYSLLNASSLDDDVNITSINSSNYQNNKHNRERNNDNSNNSGNNNFIHQKKRNKTQRNSFQKNTTTEGFYTPKVNTLLNAIHNSSNNEDSDDENNYHSLQNYIPLQPPESVGVQNTILKEDETKKIKTSSDYSNSKYNSNSPSIIDNPEEYYNKMLPNGVPDLSNYSLYNNTTDVSLIPPQPSTHNPVANSYYNNNNNINTQQQFNGGNDILVTKLNYLIHLLEEQKSEKTGNILEEVILYSFLGIFIIFVIDSFTRLGKYTR